MSDDDKDTPATRDALDDDEGGASEDSAANDSEANDSEAKGPAADPNASAREARDELSLALGHLTSAARKFVAAADPALRRAADEAEKALERASTEAEPIAKQVGDGLAGLTRSFVGAIDRVVGAASGVPGTVGSRAAAKPAQSGASDAGVDSEASVEESEPDSTADDSTADDSATDEAATPPDSSDQNS